MAKTYEDIFVGNAGLQAAIDTVISKLVSGGKVLDVSCGTGKPVSEKFTQAGFEVHGTDISQNMVGTAGNQVKGRFVKSDMKDYVPHISFDAIVASFSLLQLTKGETYTMILKFSEWLVQGGYFVPATLSAELITVNPSLYDSSGDCARHVKVPWMGYDVDTTLFTVQGWSRLLEKAGFAMKHDNLCTLEHPVREKTNIL